MARNKNIDISAQQSLDDQLLKLKANITTFAKLTALRQLPHEVKYIQDEFDLLDGLDIIEMFLQDTIPLLGKQKYKGSGTFDFVRDVKENVEELFLPGKTAQENAIARKKFGAMYHLVLEPTLEMLRLFNHEQALEQSPILIDHVRQLIINNDAVAHFDDALVSKEIVRQMIVAREELRKQQKKSRRRKPKDEIVVFSELNELNFD